MEKDPKPSNVSLEEYQRKNRQGFCWRDQKYYTPDELKQKAMLSLVEDVLLPELEFYKTGEVLNADEKPFGPSYRADCQRDSLRCRLWLIPKAYPNQELFDLYKLNPYFLYGQILSESNKVQIYAKDDVTEILFNSMGNKSTLISVHVDGADLYPSDCCTIKSHQEMMADGEKWGLRNGEFTGYPYKGYALPHLNTQDYGVGNYFWKQQRFLRLFCSLFLMLKNLLMPNAEKFTHAYFLNNCGDVLFKPYYYRR